MTNLQRWIVALTVLTVSACAAAATVDELLTKAKAQPLTAEECGQLSQALAQRAHSTKWVQIAKALKDNWDRSAITAWQQASMMVEVRPELAKEEEPRMVAALYELYSPGGGVLKRLDSGEAAELIKLLFGLGEKAGASDLLAGWMTANDEWKTKANHDQLPELMNALQPGSSEAVGRQKVALAGHVWGKYLAAGATERDKATFSQWMYILWTFRGQLSAEQVQDLAPRLLARLKDPKVVSAAKVGDIRTVESLPGGFGLTAPYPDVAATWVSASEQWLALAGEDLVTLALAIDSGTSALAKQQAGKLPALFVEKYFGANSKPVPLPEALYLSRRIFSLLSLVQRRQAADKLAPAAGQAQSVYTLAELAEVLRQAERVGKDNGYAEYAQALARLLKAGGVVVYGRLMALPLGTAQTRAALWAELTGPNDAVRREVAWVLAWAYREYESLVAWRALIEQKLADKSITGDQRAGWLLARADVELCQVGPGAVSPLAGRKWIDQALAASVSEAMKLQCIEDLALGQVKLLRADKARALLAGVEGQFQAEESRTKLTELRQRVDALSAQIRDDSKAKALASRVRARQMHLAELQRRLEAARRAGDREEVRRYERLLSNQ